MAGAWSGKMLASPCSTANSIVCSLSALVRLLSRSIRITTTGLPTTSARSHGGTGATWWQGVVCVVGGDGKRRTCLGGCGGRAASVLVCHRAATWTWTTPVYTHHGQPKSREMR
jgi:hypothetical protein